VAKEKVTLTVDTAQLAELRQLVGARIMSSAVEHALAEYLAKARHFAAVDEWLAEMDRDDGPVPPETLEWARELVDKWLTGAKSGRRSAPKKVG
jgi:hypothetical protein